MFCVGVVIPAGSTFVGGSTIFIGFSATLVGFSTTFLEFSATTSEASDGYFLVTCPSLTGSSISSFTAAGLGVMGVVLGSSELVIVVMDGLEVVTSVAAC